MHTSAESAPTPGRTLGFDDLSTLLADYTTSLLKTPPGSQPHRTTARLSASEYDDLVTAAGLQVVRSLGLEPLSKPSGSQQQDENTPTQPPSRVWRSHDSSPPDAPSKPNQTMVELLLSVHNRGRQAGAAEMTAAHMVTPTPPVPPLNLEEHLATRTKRWRAFFTLADHQRKGIISLLAVADTVHDVAARKANTAMFRSAPNTNPTHNT